MTCSPGLKQLVDGQSRNLPYRRRIAQARRESPARPAAGPHDPSPTWALPGGVVKSGELLSEALARELNEETGLEVVAWGGLIYLAQVDQPASGKQSLVFVFEVTRWKGQLRSTDPDSLIFNVRFLPISEALQKLEALPWQMMREPIVAYLKGEVEGGRVWQYRVESEAVFMISMATA